MSHVFVYESELIKICQVRCSFCVVIKRGNVVSYTYAKPDI